MEIKTRKILDFSPIPTLFLGKGLYTRPTRRDAVDHVTGTPFEVNSDDQVQTLIRGTVIKLFFHTGDLGWPSSGFALHQKPIVRAANPQDATTNTIFHRSGIQVSQREWRLCTNRGQSNRTEIFARRVHA